VSRSLARKQRLAAAGGAARYDYRLPRVQELLDVHDLNGRPRNDAHAVSKVFLFKLYGLPENTFCSQREKSCQVSYEDSCPRSRHRKKVSKRSTDWIHVRLVAEKHGKDSEVKRVLHSWEQVQKLLVTWRIKKTYSKKQMSEDNTFILMLQNSAALFQLLCINAKLDSIRRLLDR
jgi:hypothetical protein